MANLSIMVNRCKSEVTRVINLFVEDTITWCPEEEINIKNFGKVIITSAKDIREQQQEDGYDE